MKVRPLGQKNKQKQSHHHLAAAASVRHTRHSLSRDTADPAKRRDFVTWRACVLRVRARVPCSCVREGVRVSVSVRVCVHVCHLYNNNLQCEHMI